MKISKIISGIAAGVFAAMCMTFTAFAEPQDFEPSVARAVQTNGAWEQSITYSNTDINPAGITPDSVFEVQYELDGDEALPNQHQVELIFQNYTADPQIWAQIVPYEYDETHALFDYDAMVLAYGSDDFSNVNNICIGDRGVKMIVTYVKITNYDPPAKETAATTAETEAETAAEITEAPAETAAAETTAADTGTPEASSGNSVVLIIIIIAAVVVVTVVVVIIIVTKKNKKRFY